MEFAHITLFPEWMQQAAQLGVTGRAIEAGQVGWRAINPRDFSTNDYGQIDDRPFGGGPGMVMQYEPMVAAIEAAKSEMPTGSPVVYLSPQGQTFAQSQASKISTMPGIILISGRYEGIDERIIESHVDQIWSLGDFVLSGGEPAALAICDAIIRLLPGVLGEPASLAEESFNEGRLDYPQYTRPDTVRSPDGEVRVPEVLLSGDHQAIAEWRAAQRAIRTYLHRPDLIEYTPLSQQEQQWLDEYLAAHKPKA